jgi:transcriptional regulator with XRE-family HTH domain
MPARTQSRDPNVELSAFLGQQLKEIRVDAGYRSQEDLASIINKDRSVIGRAESGESPPTDAVLADWLDQCGVTGRLRTVLAGITRIARMRDGGHVKAAPWFETEARAHTLRYWAPIIVPGIAQTEAYARELFVATGMDTAKVSEFLEIRMGRQAIIGRPDAPDITVVLWEPVLHHQIGTSEVMRGQMARLIELSRLPTTTVHILLSRLGANGGLGGPINLAATDDAPELLGSDGLVEDQLTQDPAVVRKARATFNNVRADALSRVDSRDTLTEAMERWNS